jgi:hypothetical protein
MKMTGIFGYSLNCSIPHHVPQGHKHDSKPLIVFPRRTHEPVIGRAYEFEVEISDDKTVVVEKIRYHIAHAVYLRDVADIEGDSVDVRLYAKDRHVHRGRQMGAGLISRRSTNSTRYEPVFCKTNRLLQAQADGFSFL